MGEGALVASLGRGFVRSSIIWECQVTILRFLFIRYKKTAIARGHSASNGIIGVEFHEIHDDDDDDYDMVVHHTPFYIHV